MVNGIIGKKLGMTQFFAPDGTVTPVTVIKAGPAWSCRGRPSRRTVTKRSSWDWSRIRLRSEPTNQ